MSGRAGVTKAAAVLARTVGVRHARRRPLRTALTIAGVAAGVALVFAVQVMNTTLERAVTGLPDALGGRDGLVVSSPSSTGLDAATVDLVADTDGVETAAPILLNRTEVSGRSASGEAGESVQVLGVTPELSTFGTDADDLELVGGFGADGGGLVLAASLARDLGLDREPEGVPVEALTPSGRREAPVTGTIDGAGVDEVNGGAVALMELEAAQRLFDRPERIDLVVVTGDGGDRDALRERLEAGLAGQALVGQSAAELNGTAIAQPFADLTTLIGLVALLVAAFVVLNTMWMSVAERRRDLSMARVLGARPREVRRAVLAEAAVLGAVATVIGVLVGLALSRVLVSSAAGSYSVLLDGASVGAPRVQADAVAFALFAGIVVCLLGAFLPARQALRSAPLEAVRRVAPYEWSRARHPGPGRTLLGVGTALVALGLLAGVGAESADLPLPARAAAVVALLTGIVMLVPVVTPVAVRTLRPALQRRGGTVGRLAADEMSSNRRRVSTQVGVLVVSLSLVVGLAGVVGAMVDRFDEIAHDYISAPIYVEAESTISYVAAQPLAPAIEEDLAQVDGVRAVLPGRTAYVTVGSHPAVVYGNPISAAERAGVLPEMRDGELAPDPDAFVEGLLHGEIAASQRAADTLGLEVGEDIALPTSSGDATLRIAAVYEDIAPVPTFIVDHDRYVELWEDGDVQRLQVFAEPDREGDAMAGIESFAESRGLPIEVYTRDEAIARSSETLLHQFDLARAIQWAVLLVGGLGMTVTFFTTVMQQRWQNSMQRILGMTRRQLGRILVLEALVVAVLGWIGAVFAGVGLGWLLGRAAEVNLGTSLPLHVPGLTLAIGLLAALAAALAAAAYPRWVATRTPVVDVIRSE